MSKLDQTILVYLQGQIERITYTNDENGYTIAKLKVYDQNCCWHFGGAHSRRDNQDERTGSKSSNLSVHKSQGNDAE
jgi:hypothetical protein